MPWDWIASVGTLLSMALIGRHMRVGWVVGLVNQVPWFALTIQTRQWGLLPLEIILTVMYATFFLRWRRR